MLTEIILFCLTNIFLQTELPNDVDIDLDEILDIEDENQRKKFIRVSRTRRSRFVSIFQIFILNLLSGHPQWFQVFQRNHKREWTKHLTSQSSRFYICQFSEIYRRLVGASQDSVISLCHQRRTEKTTINGRILSL